MPVCARKRPLTGWKKARTLAFPGLCLLLALLLPAAPFAAAVLPTSARTKPADVPEGPIPNLPVISVSLSGTAAIVLETGRSRILFERNSDQVISSEAAAKLMTALIASEQLKPETMITISSDAASVPDTVADLKQAPLKTGEKYSFEYLLLRLVFYDSDAAAVALAEQISGEEAEFVKVMNSKAQRLELSHTHFVSSTGLPSPGSGTAEPQAEPATTTLREMARLGRAASQNKFLASALGRRNDYLVLPGHKVVSMHHQLEALFTLSEDQVSGIYYTSRSYATTLTFGMVGEIPVLTLVYNGQSPKAIEDTVSLYDAIGRTYEVATLVEAGEHFFGGQEQTVDGETFGLIYLKTITYVRPKGQDFLESTVRYQSFGPFSRPVLSGVVVGQAIFQLLDGTTIAVDVGPDRQILSNVTLIDRGLRQLEANPNLAILVLVLLALLILILIIHIIQNLVRIYRLTRLLIYEIRSRRQM
jgi:D-alanyl-D-alanine carboxypeptidase